MVTDSFREMPGAHAERSRARVLVVYGDCSQYLIVIPVVADLVIAT